MLIFWQLAGTCFLIDLFLVILFEGFRDLKLKGWQEVSISVLAIIGLISAIAFFVFAIIGIWTIPNNG